MSDIQSWVNRKYYALFPEALLLETVDFLGLSFWEAVGYAECRNLKEKWVLLTDLAELRRSYDDERVLPLLAHMKNLGIDKGW